MIEIREYLDDDGGSPFAQWLDGLRDRKVRARVLVRINRLRLGNFGDCKPVGEGVFELRLMHGPGYRVYFGRLGQSVVLLLGGGDKRSQDADIERAKRLWKEIGNQRHG
jgi:putative addiction module killer protein